MMIRFHVLLFSLSAALFALTVACPPAHASDAYLDARLGLSSFGDTSGFVPLEGLSAGFRASSKFSLGAVASYSARGVTGGANEKTIEAMGEIRYRIFRKIYLPIRAGLAWSSGYGLASVSEFIASGGIAFPLRLGRVSVAPEFSYLIAPTVPTTPHELQIALELRLF